MDVNDFKERRYIDTLCPLRTPWLCGAKVSNEANLGTRGACDCELRIGDSRAQVPGIRGHGMTNEANFILGNFAVTSANARLSQAGMRVDLVFRRRREVLYNGGRNRVHS